MKTVISDKENVLAAMEQWAEAFQADNPAQIFNLYAKDAVLWGTVSPTRRDNPEAICEYFTEAFLNSPVRKVIFKDPLIRIYGDIAINTGYYTFTVGKEGATMTFPARYSFTYMNRGGSWMIIDHHSSLMPQPITTQ